MSKLPALKKKLKKWFNEFIRLRDSKAYGFTAFKCISCGKIKSIVNYRDGGGSNFHAGHLYHASVSSALEYDEINVNSQCSACNLYKHGDQLNYLINLQLKHPKRNVSDYLQAKKGNITKYFPFELEEMIEKYTVKVKELRIERDKILN